MEFEIRNKTLGPGDSLKLKKVNYFRISLVQLLTAYHTCLSHIKFEAHMILSIPENLFPFHFINQVTVITPVCLSVCLFIGLLSHILTAILNPSKFVDWFAYTSWP